MYITRSLALLLGILFTSLVQAAESLDFVAEHILEVPMDLRYLSFPKTPLNHDEPQLEFQLGYGIVTGGKMENRFPMFSLHKYTPLENGDGLLFGLFYDQYDYSGSTGIAPFHPSFGKPDNLPANFLVDVQQVGGGGYHLGGSIAYSLIFKSGSSIQFGLALEKIHINKFKADFSTVDLPENFVGSVDYASDYSIYTPFVSFEWRPIELFSGWLGQASIISAKPGPHVGFKGRFQGPGFDFDSDTDAVGKGKHIPDPYLGFNFVIRNESTGIAINVGAILFSYLVEPKAHSDTDAPIFLNISRAW